MYINTQTNQYPISEGEIRAEYPNTSFATPFIPPDKYQWVFANPAPQYDQLTKFVREVSPKKIGDTYHQNWEVLNLDSVTIEQNQLAASERLKAEVVFNTQKRLDNWANTRNYDGILSLCTYATSTIQRFQTEGQRGVDNRDATWSKLYQILADIESGIRPVPNGYADIESELPELVWPQ